MPPLESKRPLIYLAGPLFSDAELTFNLRVCSVLETCAEVYLPQRDGGKVVDLVSKGVEASAAYKTIYDRDIEALNEADILFLVMDGRSIDEGAAFELGYAVACGKLCFGLQTDPRRLLPLGNNPMIHVPLSKILYSFEEMKEWTRTFSIALND